MNHSYRATLRAGLTTRLQSVADGSDHLDDVVAMIVDEVEHAFAQGQLSALAHLREEESFVVSSHR